MRLNTILALTIVLLPLTTHAATTQPFILGADISWVPEDEADGATYFDHGVQKDIFQILHDNQFNMIRLRVFVHPHAPHGYAAGKAEAFCDLAHTLAMAKRAQAAGMGLLISLHYSDTWTNPEGHPKPHAWDGMTVEQLAGAVHDHTRDVLAALKDQGTPADMVAIGNEVTHGMLWPEGRVWSHIPSGNAQTDAANTNLGPGNGNYDNFATFL
ncbi:MAG TPA: glycosyl hydrolase 53 family protein, partial [Tepidisphaeraceae bacterium]|nr:glycosyl hydrolase 53 family protein [Tepidisphaeraceae bacterium]